MSIRPDEKPTMLKAKDVRPNGFSDNLGSDFIAVDGYGNPVARASDKESVERAAPNHSGIFTGKDFPKDGPKDNGGPEEPILKTDTGLNTTGPGIDSAAIATQHKPEDDPNADKTATFEDAVEGADKAKDDGAKDSEKKTASDAKANNKSDDKTTSRQRKPAGE